ncbi:hypothetical protein ABZ234_07975 [Nocardiopsis sp. NPDC006198]|uniref:hypothetical protein n=1 Tax=Nocardiopsis sp. NPDC006198 TaxID=3154472 RepID=UPI0033A94510
MGREFTPFASSPQTPRLRLVLVGGAIVLAVGAFGLGRLTMPDEAPAPDAGAPSETAPSEAATPPEGGPLDAQDVTWREHGGVRVPFSATHGPAEDEGGWVRGFERTEQGAVLAGTHIFLQASGSADMPEEAINASLTQQLTGEHAPTFAEGIRERGFDPDPSRSDILVEAYSIHEFNDTGAVFELALSNQGSDGSTITTSTVITMMWQDGDWQMLVPENTMEHVRVLENLDGFTPFPDDES